MKIHRKLRDTFNHASEKYNRLAVEVNGTLKNLVESEKWFYTSRVKELESFALKVETARVQDPSKLEDFFACTIILKR